jgi:cytochrome c oxidase assembly factor CtaG
MNAGGAALYVAAIASFLFYIPKFFDQAKEDTVMAPILMLMLLVFSAALMGSLIFGRPVIWYLEGRKQEAVHLLISTLLILLVIVIAVFLAVYFL